MVILIVGKDHKRECNKTRNKIRGLQKLSGKSSLSASDAKRIQTPDGLVSYSYDAVAGRLCKKQFKEYTHKNLV